MKNHLKKNKTINWIAHHVSDVVSIIILTVTIGVVMFAAMQAFVLFQNILEFNSKEILRKVALIVILVKAYRLLIYYMQSHHVSIRYIVEISIIAPSVEIIFTPENRSLELNILYAVFAIANLLIYLKLCSSIDRIDIDIAEETD